MYVPTHFEMPAGDVAAALAQLTAADLITAGPDGLEATFLPLLHEPADDGPGRLLGHVARNNSHWRAAGGEVESLVIVRGPDAYISPTWYATKREHGRVVPTWNYTTLHVYGQLIAHDDPEWLRDVVVRLTDRHEGALAAAAGSPAWQVSDAPEAYIAGQLRAIVGLELQITRVQGKAKLSQNRSEEDRAGVIAGLRKQNPTPQLAQILPR